MTAEILSWIIPLVGAACFWVCIKHPWGWFVGIVQQAMYLAYAFVTHNWGFILHSLIFTAIFIRNYIVDNHVRSAMQDAQFTISTHKHNDPKKTRAEIKHIVKRMFDEGYDVIAINGHKIPEARDDA